MIPKMTSLPVIAGLQAWYHIEGRTQHTTAYVAVWQVSAKLRKTWRIYWYRIQVYILLRKLKYMAEQINDFLIWCSDVGEGVCTSYGMFFLITFYVIRRLTLIDSVRLQTIIKNAKLQIITFTNLIAMINVIVKRKQCIKFLIYRKRWGLGK